jgi:predicted sulfurtransferase
MLQAKRRRWLLIDIVSVISIIIMMYLSSQVQSFRHFCRSICAFRPSTSTLLQRQPMIRRSQHGIGSRPFIKIGHPLLSTQADQKPVSKHSPSPHAVVADGLYMHPQRIALIKALPVTIFVDDCVSEHLQLRPCDNKVRALFSVYNSTGSLKSDTGKTFPGAEGSVPARSSGPYLCLRALIEKKIPALANMPYMLRYKFQDERTVFAKSFEQPGKDENQLLELLRQGMPSPTNKHRRLQLYVQANAPQNFPPHPFPWMRILNQAEDAGDRPLPAVNMPDPLSSPTISIVSFYKFADINNTESLVQSLKRIWRYFGVCGRVYVAEEGINAQMAVPTNVVPYFQQATQSCISAADNCRTQSSAIPSAGASEDKQESLFMNIDHLMTRQDYELLKPFDGLHLRIRDQLVNDGFYSPSKLTRNEGSGQSSSASQPVKLDCLKPRRELSADEWNADIGGLHPTKDADGEGRKNALVLDCRNSYESDIGKFVNAVPLQTTFFRESWAALQEKLDTVQKDTPIRTYCTGNWKVCAAMVIHFISILYRWDSMREDQCISRRRAGIYECSEP